MNVLKLRVDLFPLLHFVGEIMLRLFIHLYPYIFKGLFRFD